MFTRFIPLAGPPKKKVKWATTHTHKNLRFCPSPHILKWATLKWATHTQFENLVFRKYGKISHFFSFRFSKRKCGKVSVLKYTLKQLSSRKKKIRAVGYLNIPVSKMVNHIFYSRLSYSGSLSST